MELPLSISNLQEQWLLSFLKKLDPANITELFWQLRPYVVLHHVEFKESSFAYKIQDHKPICTAGPYLLQKTNRNSRSSTEYPKYHSYGQNRQYLQN
jgi:hypothetical protein